MLSTVRKEMVTEFQGTHPDVCPHRPQSTDHAQGEGAWVGKALIFLLILPVLCAYQDTGILPLGVFIYTMAPKSKPQASSSVSVQLNTLLFILAEGNAGSWHPLKGAMLVSSVTPSDRTFKNKIYLTDVAGWVPWQADTEMETSRMFNQEMRSPTGRGRGRKQIRQRESPKKSLSCPHGEFWSWAGLQGGSHLRQGGWALTSVLIRL